MIIKNINIINLNKKVYAKKLKNNHVLKLYY